MTKSESERIDKFLWSVRLYKTRTIATEACRGKHVLLNNQAVKASANVRIGDKIEIKVPPIIRTFEVKSLLSNRVSAKLVPEYINETTPEEAFEELRLVRKTGSTREKGSGRPTKKERRQIDKFNPYK